MNNNLQKFTNKYLTADGNRRAFIKMKELRTLWFNTGTLCNIECEGCYIESSPKNDQLLYINHSEIKKYLDQIFKLKLRVKSIGFTGGEPFMNKDIIKILKICLDKNFQVLVLTNGMQPMLNRSSDLISLSRYSKLTMRISLDHYTRTKHELIRGKNTWNKAVEGINFLNNNNFKINIASRLLWKDENETEIRVGFKNLFRKIKLNIDALDRKQLVLFPEMDNNYDISEITSSCWNKLNINRENIMCSNSRMIVKRKQTGKTSIAACTLIPYDLNFDLGKDLLHSHKKVYLNHVHCAKFCVLGGGNCQQ